LVVKGTWYVMRSAPLARAIIWRESVEAGLATPVPSAASGPPARLGRHGDEPPCQPADGLAACAAWYTTRGHRGHGAPSPRPDAAYDWPLSRRCAWPAPGWPDRPQFQSRIPGGGSRQHLAPAVHRVAPSQLRVQTVSPWGYDACDVADRPGPSTTGETASLQHMRAPCDARPRLLCDVLPHATTCAAHAQTWHVLGCGLLREDLINQLGAMRQRA
jgi:hypothetical protein